MKIRMRGDTLRLRLTRSEVAAVEAGQQVVEQTRFPDGTTLSYALCLGDKHSASLQAEDGGQLIRVQVEAAQALSWASSDEVGYSGTEPFELDGLHLLIEKDFTCITPRAGEEEIDTYPNPNAA